MLFSALDALFSLICQSISQLINNKIKMDSRRKPKSIERPCSAGILGQHNPFNGRENQIFMGLDYEEIKKCVVVLLDNSQKFELSLGLINPSELFPVFFQQLISKKQVQSRPAKYLSVKMFISFLLKNPFYDHSDIDFVLINCFCTAFKSKQPLSSQNSLLLTQIFSQLQLSLDENQVEQFQTQFLIPLQELFSFTTPYEILDQVNQSLGISTHFYSLLQSFVDFSLLDPEFVLLDSQTLFYCCLFASYSSTKDKPNNLEKYIEQIEMEVPEVKKLAESLLATLLQLSKDEEETETA